MSAEKMVGSLLLQKFAYWVKVGDGFKDRMNQIPVHSNIFLQFMQPSFMHFSL